MKQLDAKRMLQARRVIAAQRHKLYRDPNLVLVGLGIKMKDNELKTDEDPVIRFHVQKKITNEVELESYIKDDGIMIDPEIGGFETDVVEGGFDLHPGYYYGYGRRRNERASKMNPMKGGISISGAAKNNYGTLGGKVVDRETGESMILSNWHVLAGRWHIRPGLPIYQPGRRDGGRTKNTVARLTRHAMDLNIDAAVATLTGARTITNAQLELIPVQKAAHPMLGMHVTKSGRGSEVTQGMIDVVEAETVVPYGSVKKLIKHVMTITPNGRPEVSAPGDSGSWWIDTDTGQVVGLHFAGRNNPEFGLAISMPEVLDALNIDIAHS